MECPQIERVPIIKKENTHIYHEPHKPYEYPYVVLKTNPKQKNVLYFYIRLNHFTSLCMSLKNRRDTIREILNPHHEEPVEIWRHMVREDRCSITCIEKLIYCHSNLYYSNGNMNHEIPFTKENFCFLQNYDYQLEQYYNESGCCNLY